MKTAKVFQAINLATELLIAGSAILSKIAERQNARAAEGRAITDQDLDELMHEGDVQAALERAELAKAKLAQAASEG